MAKSRKKQAQSDETLVDIVEVREQAQGFLEQNQKLVLGGLTAIVVIIGGVFAYRNLIQEPQQKSAISAMFEAQRQFERDSFALALTSPGGEGQLGFLDIIDQYGSTPAGNLALYYAGVSYLNLGEYDAAIDYLQDFSAKGDLTPATKNGALGDAYSEKGDFDSAVSYYQKAVRNAGENNLLAAYYLKKLGLLYERQSQPAQALEAYQRIKEEFPQTTVANDIDKYIIRAQAGN